VRAGEWLGVGAVLLLVGRVGPAHVGVVSAGERQDYVPVVRWGRIERIRRGSVSSVSEGWWAARMLRAALGGVDDVVRCIMVWSDRCTHGQRMGQGRGTVGFCPGLREKSGDFARMGDGRQHRAVVLRWSGECLDALHHGMVRSVPAWSVRKQGPGTGREAGFSKSGDSVCQVDSGGVGGPARRRRTVEWEWLAWSILLGGWEGAPASVQGCRRCVSRKDPSSPEISCLLSGALT
jgi:hypothetical protein